MFHNFVDNNKDDLFQNGADIILERLDQVAVDVGKALEGALGNLADKVRDSITSSSCKY